MRKLNEKIKIHICDDHKIVTDGLAFILTQYDFIESVTKSNNKQELITHLINEKIDILLLDININSCNMLEFWEVKEKSFPRVKIIVFSSYQNQKLIEKAMSVGAKAYLNKNTEVEEIIFAIKKVMNDDIYISKSDYKNFSIKDNFQLIESLTNREKDILILLAKGFTNQKIADTLFISILTVQTHRKKINKKLGLKGINELIAFVYENELLKKVN